jgi:hypothetical protein
MLSKASYLAGKTIEFWTLYIVSWSAIGFGLMFLILPWVENPKGILWSYLLVLYSGALLIYYLIRKIVNNKLVSKDAMLDFSAGTLIYLFISLSLNGFLISYLFNSQFPVINYIVSLSRNDYPNILARLVVSSLLGIPILSLLAGDKSNNKNSAKEDFMLIFPSFILGMVIFSLISSMIDVEKYLDLNLIGKIIIGSLPIWYARLLIFGKNINR